MITRPERLDRLLLILAIAYLLLCGMGQIAKANFNAGAWSSNTRESSSLFLIGMTMQAKINASPQQAFDAVLELSDSIAANWG